jgi:hypothetical protein
LFAGLIGCHSRSDSKALRSEGDSSEPAGDGSVESTPVEPQPFTERTYGEVCAILNGKQPASDDSHDSDERGDRPCIAQHLDHYADKQVQSRVYTALQNTKPTKVSLFYIYEKRFDSENFQSQLAIVHVSITNHRNAVINLEQNSEHFNKYVLGDVLLGTDYKNIDTKNHSVTSELYNSDHLKWRIYHPDTSNGIVLTNSLAHNKIKSEVFNSIIRMSVWLRPGVIYEDSDDFGCSDWYNCWDHMILRYPDFEIKFESKIKMDDSRIKQTGRFVSLKVPKPS